MNYAVILSGGVGTRLGLEVPKQYYKVKGKPILQYVLETIAKSNRFAGVVIVAAKEWHRDIEEMLRGIGELPLLGFAEPGENRQLSIYHGLLALKGMAAEGDVVLIQDGARPNTTVDLLLRCLDFSDEQDGILPVLPMKDTVYLSHSGKQADALIPREKVFAGQAPEAFLYGKYLRANENLLPDRILKINGSSEPAILAGMNIAFIDGDEKNYKITTKADLERFAESL